MSENEINKRQQLALSTIKQMFGTEEGEDGVNLFVEHHLEEIDKSYWKKHLNTESPDPKSVLDILILDSHWGDDEEEIENFDFTLPDDETNYMICVSFNEEGQISDITMES